MNMVPIDVAPKRRPQKAASLPPISIEGVTLYLYPRWLGFDFRGAGHGEVAGKQAFIILRNLADAAAGGKNVEGDWLLRALYGHPDHGKWPRRPRRELHKRVCELNRALRTHAAGFRVVAEKPENTVGALADYRLKRITGEGTP
jgi:hypothetical protein